MATGSKRKPPASTGVSFEQLAARRPAELKLVLPPDEGGDELEKAVQDAQNDLGMAKLRRGLTGTDEEGAAAVKTAQRALDEAQAALEAASTVLVLRALPRSELEALRLAHPATKEQMEAAANGQPGAQPRVDPETFDPALVAASIVADPRLTPEQVSVLRDRWSDPDWETLRAGALKVNGETKIQLLGN